MTQKKAEILLAALIVARSTSFLFSKIGMGGIEIFNLLALRYLISFGILAAVFCRRLVRVRPMSLVRGALLAGVFFALLTAEMNGLKRTTASTTAFLENSAIVFVPLFNAALVRRFPKPVTLISSGIALCGVFLLTLNGGFGSFGAGELYSLLAAVLYAAYILLTARIGSREDAFEVGILQNGFLGLYGLAASLLTEAPRLPGTGVEWGCVLGLAVICSAFGLTLQPMAQSHTTPERAGLLCAVSPVSASLISMLFLGESLGTSGLIGAALIMASIFIPKLEGAFAGLRQQARTSRPSPVSALFRGAFTRRAAVRM